MYSLLRCKMRRGSGTFLLNCDVVTLPKISVLFNTPLAISRLNCACSTCNSFKESAENFKLHGLSLIQTSLAKWYDRLPTFESLTFESLSKLFGQTLLFFVAQFWPVLATASQNLSSFLTPRVSGFDWTGLQFKRLVRLVWAWRYERDEQYTVLGTLDKSTLFKWFTKSSKQQINALQCSENT